VVGAPPLTGRTAIVTGANTGLGFATAQALASRDAMVIIASRDEKKGLAAKRRIISQDRNAQCEAMKLDLASLASIEDFAGHFKSRHRKLDLLINNAGVMVPPFGTTSDGFELQFGVNHLGHFALTGRLMDDLGKSPDARIVTVSSMAHRWGNINFDDLDWSKRRYRAMAAYSASKLANLLFTYEIDRRLKAGSSPVRSVAAHPGWTGTDLQRHSAVFRFFGLVAQKIEMGVLPQLYAATADNVEGGQYYGPKSFGELSGAPRLVGSSARSHDRDIATRLWDASEDLTGVRYTF
jgi:NAD(P)-dependent dehydrogenase (short-subunit alcohol dehydrogenase family)